MPGALIRKRGDTGTESQEARRPRDDGGGDGSTSPASQGTPWIFHHQVPGKGSEEIPSMGPRGTWPCQHFRLGFPASRTEAIQFRGFRPSNYGTLLGQPRKWIDLYSDWKTDSSLIPAQKSVLSILTNPAKSN